MGALGLIAKDSQEFFKLIEHLTNKKTANYILNKTSACCIQSAYYLFVVATNHEVSLNY